MPNFDFLTFDVFTDKKFGGNPLAVFPSAAGISEQDMQAIAREFNYSEITFVLPPEDPANTARVRIFTPVREMTFAGHPNVGTGWALAANGIKPGERFVFEEIAGLVTVDISRDAGGHITSARVAAPRAFTRGLAVAPHLIAGCLQLPESAVVTTRHLPVQGNTGTYHILAELDSLASLAHAQGSADGWAKASAALPGLGKYFGIMPYVRVSDDAGRLRTRMFALHHGIIEDPATGSASSALGALLLEVHGGDYLELTLEQGIEMGRPSSIHITARRGPDGIRATIAGQCVEMMRGTLSL